MGSTSCDKTSTKSITGSTRLPVMPAPKNASDRHALCHTAPDHFSVSEVFYVSDSELAKVAPKCPRHGNLELSIILGFTSALLELNDRRTRLGSSDTLPPCRALPHALDCNRADGMDQPATTSFELPVIAFEHSRAICVRHLYAVVETTNERLLLSLSAADAPALRADFDDQLR